VATSDTVLILKTQTTGEYFILENRAAVESDTAQMNPAYSRVKSPGLYVWHIDQSRINSGSWSNTINTGAIQGVALVQADGRNQLRATIPPSPDTSISNRGDRGDAFPGSTNNTAFDGGTFPGMLTNAGQVVAGRIDSIRIGANQEVIFRYQAEEVGVFSTEAAANDLLGSPALSPAQRALLDQDGNNNGVYDLGDFLHWVTISGQGVSPELMAKLLAAAGPRTAQTPKGVTP
jgi:hypothetical protein